MIFHRILLHLRDIGSVSTFLLVLNHTTLWPQYPLTPLIETTTSSPESPSLERSSLSQRGPRAHRHTGPILPLLLFAQPDPVRTILRIQLNAIAEWLSEFWKIEFRPVLRNIVNVFEKRPNRPRVRMFEMICVESAFGCLQRDESFVSLNL